MHGRPRKAYKPEEEAASAAKAVKLRSLQSQFMSNHHHKIYTKEAIDLSTKLLEINPEAYTAWNYRKLAVEDTLSRTESNPDLVNSILDEELKVVESALRQNFKSYGAWHHRKWVLSKGHSSVGNNNELRLLDKLQSLDSRNFHAWNYRRFVVELSNRSKQDELKYTEDMISKDFSNYSAWHNRSVLLSSLLAKKAEGFMPNEKIPDEYRFVHDAIFTDEDDQSGWFYHLWLLDQTVNVETPLLASSWPSHGSRVNLSRGAGCLNDSSSSQTGSFPLILYFDQAVGGVSSSTVTIDSELKGNEDLVWEPVSNRNSQVSRVWVASLKYMSSEPCFPKEYTVKVRIGNSPGIVSSRGCNFSAPYEFIFTAHVHDDTVQEEPQEEAIVSWTDDGFDVWDGQSEDLNSLVNLDQLNAGMDLKWRQEAIAEEIELFRALSDSKIGKLTLARLLMAKAMISENDVKGVHYKEILELYTDLMALDSPHYHYYKDELSVALLHEVTSSTESLSRHLFRHRDMNHDVCLLRLNNLSLSRIASVEKLLFVQMLDLSHNVLHSIEGLEAMQLLSCLNLSHNRIRSFSALDSLRHLKQLSVLDVSHNRIGEHSVDTTRYLCSSPLSNSEWTRDEAGRQMMPSLVTKYWDAYFVLKDLNLKQLDIAGNVIAGDEFSSFVLQVVPKLVWLDGQKLRS